MKDSTITLESMSQAVWYNAWIFDKFVNFLHGDILEVGCGIGNFTNFLTRFGNVWAIDVEKEYVIKTQKLLKEKAKIGFGDIENGEYFFGNQRFDTIVCLNVLEHIKDDESALNNFFRLLKKDGRLILLVPSHKFLFGEIDKSIYHFRRYNKYEICRRLEEIGLKINKSRRLNFLGALGWFIAGKILKETSVKEKNIKIFNLIAPILLQFENLIEPPIGTSILIIAQKR